MHIIVRGVDNFLVLSSWERECLPLVIMHDKCKISPQNGNIQIEVL